MPHTLADCLHELTFWNTLYWLRREFGGENSMQAAGCDAFVFGLMAIIRPRSRQEAADGSFSKPAYSPTI